MLGRNDQYFSLNKENSIASFSWVLLIINLHFLSFASSRFLCPPYFCEVSKEINL